MTLILALTIKCYLFPLPIRSNWKRNWHLDLRHFFWRFLMIRAVSVTIRAKRHHGNNFVLFWLSSICCIFVLMPSQITLSIFNQLFLILLAFSSVMDKRTYNQWNRMVNQWKPQLCIPSMDPLGLYVVPPYILKSFSPN